VVLGVAEWIALIAGWAKHAVVCGDGAWIVSTNEARLFAGDQAIAPSSLAERLAGGPIGGSGSKELHEVVVGYLGGKTPGAGPVIVLRVWVSACVEKDTHNVAVCIASGRLTWSLCSSR
jgi:hypothetical protein